MAGYWGGFPWRSAGVHRGALTAIGLRRTCASEWDEITAAARRWSRAHRAAPLARRSNQASGHAWGGAQGHEASPAMPSGAPMPPRRPATRGMAAAVPLQLEQARVMVLELQADSSSRYLEPWCRGGVAAERGHALAGQASDAPAIAAERGEGCALTMAARLPTGGRAGRACIRAAAAGIHSAGNEGVELEPGRCTSRRRRHVSAPIRKLKPAAPTADAARRPLSRLPLVHPGCPVRLAYCMPSSVAMPYLRQIARPRAGPAKLSRESSAQSRPPLPPASPGTVPSPRSWRCG